MAFLVPFVYRGYISTGTTSGGTIPSELATLDGYDAIIWLESDVQTFQTEDESTPATTGDTVYRWNDLTTYDNHAYQPTASYRPEVMSGTTEWADVNYLQFDGSGGGNSMRVVEDVSFNSLTELTLFVYMSDNNTSALSLNETITQFSNDSINGGQSDGWLVDYQQNLGQDQIRFVYDDDTATPSGYNELIFDVDYSTPVLYTFRVSGNTIDAWTGNSSSTPIWTSSNGDGMDVPGGGQPLTIGANFTQTLGLPMDLGMYVLYEGPLSNTAVTAVQNYIMNTKFSPGGGGSPASGDLVLWTYSTTGVTESSGLISQWADQSGNGNNFNNSTAGKPFYNTTGSTFGSDPYLSFSGANDWLYMETNTSADLITPNGFTVYIVSAIQNLPHAKSFLLHKTTLGTTWQDGWGILATSDTNIRFYVNAEFFLDTGEQVNLTVSSGVTNNGQPHIFKLKYDKVNVEAEIMGPTSNVSGSTPYTDNVIDSGDGIWLSYQTTSFDIDQDVAEVLFYNGPIAASAETITETYLKAKYGIA